MYLFGIHFIILNDDGQMHWLVPKKVNFNF